MKVYFLNCGYMTPKWKYVISDPETPEECCTLLIRPVLIQTGRSNILLDTGGYSKGKGWPVVPEGNFPLYVKDGEKLEEQLALCALTPADIDVVVISHLHYDHMSGAELFEKATFYLPKLHPSIPVERSRVILEDTDLEEGIRLITLPGHTDAQIGMMVKLDESGTFLFPQDSLFLEKLYGPPARLAAPGLVKDKERFLGSIEKIRKLQQETGATIAFGHDEAFFAKMKLAPAYYE